MKLQMKLLEVAALTAMLISVVLSTLGFSGTCAEVEDDVLRLHVIANSDSAADQALKLAVRDAILQQGDLLFGHCGSREEAMEVLEANLPLFEQTAAEVIAAHGMPYAVTATLARSAFPTRTYADVTLPAGTYDALKIVIGKGAGKNWWCVMFPPLCIPAAAEGAALEDVLDADALTLVQQNPKYELRFWIVEKWREWRNGKLKVEN